MWKCFIGLVLNCHTYLKAREAAVYWYWGGNRNEPRVWGFRDDPWASRPRGWRPQPQRGQQHWHEAGGRKLIKMIWLSPGRERGDTRVLQLWHWHWHTQYSKPFPTVTLQFKTMPSSCGMCLHVISQFGIFGILWILMYIDVKIEEHSGTHWNVIMSLVTWTNIESGVNNSSGSLNTLFIVDAFQ